MGAVLGSRIGITSIARSDFDRGVVAFVLPVLVLDFAGSDAISVCNFSVGLLGDITPWSVFSFVLGVRDLGFSTSMDSRGVLFNVKGGTAVGNRRGFGESAGSGKVTSWVGVSFLVVLDVASVSGEWVRILAPLSLS